MCGVREGEGLGCFLVFGCWMEGGEFMRRSFNF